MANVETRVYKMTPEFCRELLGRNPENRRIDKRMVAQYARDMEAEQWQLNGETICIDWNGNLINGQHRCMAGVRANKPFETVLITGLPPAAKDTIDGGKKRTYGDRLAIRGYKNCNVIAANMAFMAQLASGQLKRHALSPKDLDRVLDAHPKLEDSVVLGLQSMKKVGSWVGALHYIGNYLNMGDAADEFLNVLKDGQRTYDGDAAVFFRDWFYKDMLKQNPSHIDFRRKLFVNAFNKFINTEPLRSARIPEKFGIPGWTDKELGL